MKKPKENSGNKSLLLACKIFNQLYKEKLTREYLDGLMPNNGVVAGKKRFGARRKELVKEARLASGKKSSE